ncbi:hypothetical protein CYLTODRAFT_447094 [Cylindrobasidium torrendii FP15055 ss-10]|uniref:Uncharacterized protein n=1 Tax=Cylindrobasidium torrendii FP15055 ss-10 TaxID=1314674 RepID=A0A0D7AZB0_9AGAR|nr:hypothetical protein CYLTODRAFT_447094 [Cylindrobasidium torrendii FP15055 ss-10]
MAFRRLWGSVNNIRRKAASRVHRRPGRPENSAKDLKVADAKPQIVSGTGCTPARSLNLEQISIATSPDEEHNAGPDPVDAAYQTDEMFVDTSVESTSTSAIADIEMEDAADLDVDVAFPVGITFDGFSKSLHLKLSLNYEDWSSRGIRFAEYGQAISMEDAAISLLNFLAVRRGGDVNDFPFTGLLYIHGAPTGNIYDDRDDAVVLSPGHHQDLGGIWAGKQLICIAVKIAFSTNVWVAAETSLGLLTLNLAVEITPRQIAQVAAHATAIGCYLVRMKTFPSDLSPCCLLAVLENPAALEDLSFVTAVAPELARPLLAWSDDLGNRGPFRDPGHPNYTNVRQLVELFTDVRPENLAHIDRDTESMLRTTIFLGRLLGLPTPMTPVQYENHPVVESFRRSLNPIINVRGQRLFDYEFPVGRGYKPLVAAFIDAKTPDLRYWLKFSTCEESDLIIFQEKWMRQFVRWISREGPLPHEDAREFYYNDEYQRALANRPGYRTRCVLATATGSPNQPKNLVIFAFLGRGIMYEEFKSAAPPLPFQKPFCPPPIAIRDREDEAGDNIVEIPLDEVVCDMLERTKVPPPWESEVVTEFDLYLEENFVFRGQQGW